MNMYDVTIDGTNIITNDLSNLPSIEGYYMREVDESIVLIPQQQDGESIEQYTERLTDSVQVIGVVR
jgi:hypothetical protein